MKLVIIPLALYTIFVVNIVQIFAQDLIKNQLHAYPNTNEAPTTKERVQKNDYQAPLLSRALFETDPQRKLRKPEFIDQIKYGFYQMTRGELEQIFYFADQNRDDLVDAAEWEGFTTLFILPFEACDKNSDYKLDTEEFKACFEADPKSKLILFRRRYSGENKYAMIMEMVSHLGKPLLNFPDYLFIRRSLFGWQQCHSSNKFISISSFKCAMGLAIPQKFHLRIDIENIYKMGLKNSNDKSLIELDFLTYLRTLYYAYIFGIYNLPHDIPYLEKTQFIKAIKEDRLPTNFNEEEVEILYSLINTSPFKKEVTMNFETFVFFFNLHKLWDKYSMERPLLLTFDELNKILDEPTAPFATTLAVDVAETDFKESEYLETSMMLQRLRLNERNYYYGFKEKLNQDASVWSASLYNDSTKFATYYDKKPNVGNRQVFFKTMAGTDKKYWTKEIYYRAFVMSNLFTELCQGDKRWLVSAATFLESLGKYYDTINPPINIKMRKTLILYKTIPRVVDLDLLSFLALENWQYKIEETNKSTNDLINETLLRIILQDYGMNGMPDTVIDVAKKGYDPLRRRLYDHREVIKHVINVHTAAAEIRRSNRDIKSMGLKTNTDVARQFPPLPRRSPSGPLV